MEALLQIAAAIPEHTATTFIVIQHRKGGQQSFLPQLLSGKTRLPVHEVRDKEPILPGRVYVAPCDLHLLLEDDHTFSLNDSERINYSRPSIDVTFESASALYGSALVGVLLSGANSDGAEGMKTISLNGGFTVVQLPATAQMAYMPQQALKIMEASKVIDGPQIGHFLHELLISR